MIASHRRWAVLTLSGGVIVVWIAAAAWSSRHGFDLTDEGYYLLSYRWWNANLHNFSGVQYLYGPVFEALGWSIAGLRVVRLLTIVATLAVFAVAFMRWLAARRDVSERLWRIAGAAVIVAAGGAIYGWLPLTPGYNDVSLLGTLLLMAITLRAFRSVPVWLPLSAGPVILAMLLARWSASLVVVAVLFIALVAVLRSWRPILRFAGLTVLSLLVCALLVHIFVIPLNAALPELIAVTKAVAAGSTHDPAHLVRLYWRTGWGILGRVGRTHIVVLSAMALALTVRRRWTWIVVLAGLAVSVWQARDAVGGGPVNLARYEVSLLVVVLLALLAVFLRRRSFEEWTVLVLLLVLPFLQAVGTDNPLHLMAINGYALWMAFVVAVFTSLPIAPARFLLGVAAALSLVATASIAVGGTLLHPYRSAPYSATTTASDVPALSSLYLAPAQAAQYSALTSLLRPYTSPPGRAIMAFDKMAGVVLMLDGRPVGEAWYPSNDPRRTATGIRSICSASGGPWWGSRLPVLIFSRPVTARDRAVLADCALDLDTDYRIIPPSPETMNLTIYVPAGE